MAELRSPTNVADAATNFGYYKVRIPQVTPGSSPGTNKSETAPGSRGSINPYPGEKFAANYHDQPKRGMSQGLKKPRATVAHLRPPAWDVSHRYQARPADMLTKLSHVDVEGLNSPSAWDSSNGCNKDIPGGEAARMELKETLALNQKMNASKRLTNWSYAHGGEELNPGDWASTTTDQMLNKQRIRTPKKSSRDVHELRDAPWSVAERHAVHLQKYDHRLVGLRRPEPLAKGAP